MVEFLKSMAAIMNDFHDLMIDIVDIHAHPNADKWLHFIIIAIVGMVIFACVHALFKFLSKFSVTAISFIYTITLVIVIVFAIEIQQKITGRGNVEVADIVFGLGGFLFVFTAYLIIKKLCVAVKRKLEKEREDASQEKSKEREGMIYE